MKKYTLDKDSLPFNFFDEVDFSFKDEAIDFLKTKHSHLSDSECENVFEENEDFISEIMYELIDSDALNDYWIGDDEIDESSGTWGYSIYEVGDVKQARIKLKKAVKVLLEEVVNEIDM
jgi:hypothetical protein